MGSCMTQPAAVTHGPQASSRPLVSYIVPTCQDQCRGTCLMGDRPGCGHTSPLGTMAPPAASHLPRNCQQFHNLCEQKAPPEYTLTIPALLAKTFACGQLWPSRMQWEGCRGMETCTAMALASAHRPGVQALRGKRTARVLPTLGSWTPTAPRSHVSITHSSRTRHSVTLRYNVSFSLLPNARNPDTSLAMPFP